MENTAPTDHHFDETKAILELAYKAYWDEYREQTENWKTIEAKAQAMINCSGIFLAAAFAFSREASLATPVVALTIATLLLLFLSMRSAMQVLKTKDYLMPVDGSHSIDIGRTGLMHPTQLNLPRGNRLSEMYDVLFEDHRSVLLALQEVIRAKLSALKYSYRFLFWASFCAVLASAVHIISTRVDTRSESTTSYHKATGGENFVPTKWSK